MIAAFGECMIEITERGGVIRSSHGGDTLNTLTYLARLLPQRRDAFYYVTGMGDDPFSSQMIKSWRHEGISPDLVRRLKGRLPGLYYVRTDVSGERQFFYWRAQSAARSFLTGAHLRKLLAGMSGCELFYFSGISLAILPGPARYRLLELVDHLKERGARLVFDSNYRPSLWKSAEEAREWMGKVYPRAAKALVTFSDEQTLHGDRDPEHTCRRLQELGTAEVVVKNGIEPCTVACEGQVDRYPMLMKVKPVDTTAAGDAFNAAYVAARLQGQPIRTAISAGNHLASVVVQHPGAIIPVEKTPALHELT